MAIKSLTTNINSEFVSLTFPKAKTVVLKGKERKCEQIIYLLECALLNDYTDYYGELDRQRGYDYYPLTSQTNLVFSQGSIVCNNKKIEKTGIIPKYHVIRYVAGSEIRSFIISDSLDTQHISTNAYSSHLTMDTWIRITENVNKVCGVDFCKVVNNQLVFNEEYKDELSYRIVYMLISECFVTPTDYKRIILLPNIPCMSSKMQAKLVEALDNFKEHSMTITSCNIEPELLQGSGSVEFMYV